MIDIHERPRPIKQAADELKGWIGLLTLIVGGAAGAGVNLLTDEQASALTALLSAIPGVVGLVGTVLVAFGIVRRSEPVVTPLIDPKAVDSRTGKLVPLVAVGE